MRATRRPLSTRRRGTRWRDTATRAKWCRATVDEALRTRPDYEMRKKDVGEWRRNNLIAQFKAAGLELTPDVWERLAADRRQALEDDLAWIHP